METETAQPERERAWDGVLRREIDVEFRSINEDERSFEVIASTETLDSHGDVMKQFWDLERYQKNSVVLWNHNIAVYMGCESEDTLPIGKASDVRIEGKALLAKISLVKGDSSTEPLIDKIWRRIQQGVLKAVSVGFRAGQVTAVTDAQGNTDYYELGSKERPNELREISLVPMGSNPDAVAKSIAWERKHLMVDATVHVAVTNPDEPDDAAPAFAVGDRVESLVDHMPGMKGTQGTVALVREGDPPYYGVQFDGQSEVHKWLAEDELKATSSDAAKQISPSPPVSVEPTTPSTGKESKTMADKPDVSQFVQAITLALGLPIGSTESDLLARGSALSTREKEFVSVTGAKSSDEAIGALRGIKTKADQLELANAELTKVRGERDRQNFDTQISLGKSDRKLDKAMADLYEAEFEAAPPETRSAVVDRLRGHLKVLRPVAFPAQAKQVASVSTMSGAELTWQGKTYAQLGPQERANLKSADPEMALQMRRDWEAAGKPSAAIAG